MRAVSIPDDLYQKAVEIAETQQVPVDEVFASAFVEQLAAWDRLKHRAATGSRDKFLAVLDKVPDVDPEEYDQRRRAGHPVPNSASQTPSKSTK